MRLESEHGLVTGKIGGRDVFVLMVAFVVMFVHADKLTLQMRGFAEAQEKNSRLILSMANSATL